MNHVNMLNGYAILLASQSIRRKEILSNAGFQVRTIAADIDESLDKDWSPVQAAMLLAEKKADAISNLALKNEVIIAADTIVVLNDKIYGKPENLQESLTFLRDLSGHTHQVITGVCIVYGGQKLVFQELTNVHFRSLVEQEINYYIHNYETLDKAAAYGIQDWIGWVGVTKIEGCYLNVVGLPLPRLILELQKLVF